MIDTINNQEIQLEMEYLQLRSQSAHYNHYAITSTSKIIHLELSLRIIPIN